MGRKKRSEMTRDPNLFDDIEYTPQEAADLVTWHTHETPRFWCPLCSMVSDVERLEGAPYDLHMALQRYGGKLPNGKGYIQYFDLPREDSVVLAAQMIPVVEDLLVYLREMAGDTEAPPLEDYRLPTFQPSQPEYLEAEEDEEELPPSRGYNLLDDLDDLDDEDLDDDLLEERRRRRLYEPESRSGLPSGTSSRPALPQPQNRAQGLPSGERRQVEGRKQRKALPPPRE